MAERCNQFCTYDRDDDTQEKLGPPVVRRFRRDPRNFNSVPAPGRACPLANDKGHHQHWDCWGQDEFLGANFMKQTTTKKRSVIKLVNCEKKGSNFIRVVNHSFWPDLATHRRQQGLLGPGGKTPEIVMGRNSFTAACSLRSAEKGCTRISPTFGFGVGSHGMRVGVDSTEICINCYQEYCLTGYFSS